MQDHRHAALGIGHARAIGALALDAERALGHGTGAEHRVVVDHQQEVLVAGALECADDVVAHRRRGWLGGDLGAEGLEAFHQLGTDLFQARLGTGAGVYRNQGLEGFQVVRLFGLGLAVQLLGRGLDGLGGGAGEGEGQSAKSQMHGQGLVVMNPSA